MDNKINRFFKLCIFLVCVSLMELMPLLLFEVFYSSRVEWALVYSAVSIVGTLSVLSLAYIIKIKNKLFSTGRFLIVIYLTLSIGMWIVGFIDLSLWSSMMFFICILCPVTVFVRMVVYNHYLTPLLMAIVAVGYNYMIGKIFDHLIVTDKK